ncbi:MAG: shikimate kinase [Clostridia bacterium]
MDELRNIIDELDAQLIGLLEQRMAVVREIGAQKRTTGQPIFDAKRERAVLKSRADMVKDEANQDYVHAFMLQILGFSRREQRRQYNVYLIGMPGAGKSRFAELMRRTTGLNKLDTDALVEQATGMSIPEIFSEYGEARFRQYEHEALVECARRGGSIVATGGGIISEDNIRLMHGSGRIVLLNRGLESLLKQDLSGRPLIKNAQDIRKLYEERLPIYVRAADIILDPDALGVWRTLWDYCVE